MKFSTPLLVLSLFLACCGEKEEKKEQKPKTEDKKETTQSPPEEQPEEKKEVWQYEERKDEMSNEISYFAYVESTNKIEFEFPYQGGSTFTLAIRNIKGANDAILVVSKGHFMHNLMGNEYLRVKFDAEETFNLPFASSNDGKANRIFLETNLLLDKLKKSKKLMIEAPFFNAGRKIIKFDIEGLKWDK